MNQTTLAILLPLLPLAGVVLGAFLQSFLQVKRERVSQKQNLKIKAYTDYLQAASILSNGDPTKRVEAKVLLTDARLRILIYGSLKVIESIATFDRTGSNLDTPEGMKTFLPIISAMREDGSGDEIKKEDLTQILFRRDQL
jgi:hypothetical protein